MKFLHTADWHVGKTMRGASRADEHRAVLAEIAEIAGRESVDAVLVAGDLFETAAPAPESEHIVYEALLALAATGAEIVVIAGNHDNPRRLAAVAPLLELGRVHLATDVRRPDSGGVVDIAGTGQVLRVGTLPFVSQRSIVRAADLLDKDATQLSPKYAERMRRVIEVVTGFVGERDDAVEVVCAHAFVDGGTLGGGERSAHTIFEYAIPAAAFPNTLHYVALGHLHRAQTMPAGCPVRYSGSPLQLDFGETADTKSVTLVEAEPDVPATVTPIELEQGRRLRTVSGSLAEIESLAGTTGDDHLRVIVIDNRTADLAERIRSWLPNTVDVIVRPPDDEPTRRSPRPDRSGASPRELFGGFLDEQNVADERLLAAFDALLDEAV